MVINEIFIFIYQIDSSSLFFLGFQSRLLQARVRRSEISLFWANVNQGARKHSFSRPASTYGKNDCVFGDIVANHAINN